MGALRATGLGLSTPLSRVKSSQLPFILHQGAELVLAGTCHAALSEKKKKINSILLIINVHHD